MTTTCPILTPAQRVLAERIAEAVLAIPVAGAEAVPDVPTAVRRVIAETIALDAEAQRLTLGPQEA
jgi:hypothetical protein